MGNTDELKYWIALSRIPGIGRVEMSQLQEHFITMEQAWNGTSSELKRAGLDTKTVDTIVNARHAIYPDAELDRMDHYKVKALICESPDYPQRLKEIYDYPPVLYVRGDLLPDDQYCLAVVGTRKATVYGRQATEDIVTELARNRITIVSGLAKGIDSIAHRAALEAGGRTIAVFGCGLDIVYPAANARLARDIMGCGALLSEYPLGILPKADNLPRRNRIISGMSLGVLVVEAGESSGALITAHQAVEQNRDVFAVPDNIMSPASRGTNHLIQDGAKLVRSAVDVLEELNLAMDVKQLEMKVTIAADETEALLLKQLGHDPIHIDEICRTSRLAMPLVSSTLAIMQIRGMVRQVSGMYYTAIKEIREEYQTQSA